MERELGYKLVQTAARLEPPATMQFCWTYARCCHSIQTSPKLAKRPFHGGNTGSNPVGDANKSMSYKRPVYSLHNSPQQSCVNNLTRAHDQIRQALLRLAFWLVERLRIAIHGGLKGGVPQEFLHNFRIHTQRLD
jgi:hypothetical protein